MPSTYRADGEDDGKNEQSPSSTDVRAYRRTAEGTKEGARLEHGDDVGGNVIRFLCVARVAKVFLEVGLRDDASTNTSVGVDKCEKECYEKR